MVEVEIVNHPPTALLIPFAMNTAVLTFVHLFSLMIATRLLPELDAIVLDTSSSSLSQPYLSSVAAKLARSWPVQMCWVLSNIVGIVLFITEVVLVAYVKFYPGGDDADPRRLHAGTATLVVVVVLSLIAVPFIVIFFRSVSKQKLQIHEQRLEKARVLFESLKHGRRMHEAPVQCSSDRAHSHGDVFDTLSLNSYHSSESFEQTPRDTQV